MARSKMVKADNLPASVLKQTYEENTLVDGRVTEDSQRCSHEEEDSHPRCSIDMIDEPSTSSGTSTDDFDLINSVKEDLKQNIHKRRRQKGLGDLDLVSDFQRTYQLTDTEKRKRRDRRERNRIAAVKCREKKRHITNGLLQDSEQLEKKNRDLKEQAEQLRLEKDYLKQLLREHLAVCPKKGLSGCR
ncbi:cyclic AMP-dependent transcription factor ATF-3-like [Amphiura filiformis]|uniref:cyclic AMP-dependent transcription factor ATF-3-like n=1 Tax=Amphiura filiformis TaxID=82378 RepID=UPI003B21C1FB